MKTCTIDENHSITVFATKEEAAATGGLTFTSQKELAKLSAEWPIGRFTEIWNGFVGVAPFSDLKSVKKFTDRKTAVARTWQAIQRLDAQTAASSITEDDVRAEPEAIVTEEGPEITPEEVAQVPALEAAAVDQPALEFTTERVFAAESVAAREVPNVPPQVRDVASEPAAATIDASPAENVAAAPKTPRRKKASKPESESAAASRETKLSQVVAMLQRPEGATITEVIAKMGWLKHTVRASWRAR